MNEDVIRAQLNEIVDPCSVVAGAPAGIVELGLVRALSVKQAPGGVAIEVRIGVTEPGCMMGASFALRARERLEALAGVVSVDVALDHEADWEPDDIDPAYARRLAAVRAQRRAAAAPAAGQPLSDSRNSVTIAASSAGLSTWAK